LKRETNQRATHGDFADAVWFFNEKLKKISTKLALV
jgi:hypothetical protein